MTSEEEMVFDWFREAGIELTDAVKNQIRIIKGQGSKGTQKWAGPLTNFYTGKLLAKHSASLYKTTLVLTIATIVLAIATIALVLVTAKTL